MSRFPKLLTGLFRDFRNSYNAGVDLIEKDIDKSLTDSVNAINKAAAAESKADSVQEQLNQVVIDGDSSPAIAQALAGTPYNTLREKLDSTDAHLAHTTQDLFYKDLVNHKTQRGMITILDDDTRLQLYDLIYPVILEEQVPLTSAAVTGRIQNNNVETINIEKYKEMLNSGLIEFISHTVNHVNLTSLTLAEAEAELRDSQEWIKQNGGNPDYFVYPFNGMNKDIRDLTRKYYKAGFSTNNKLAKPPLRMFAVNRVDFESTFEQQKAWIDEAVATNSWIIFNTHSSYPSFTAQGLRDLITYAKSVGIEFVTIEKAMKSFGNLLELGDYEDTSGDYSVIDAKGKIHGKLVSSYKFVPNTGITASTPITSFTPDAITTSYFSSSAASAAGFPSAGTLFTDRRLNDDYSTQTFFSFNSVKSYRRYWSNTSSSWSAFESASENYFHVKENQNAITSTTLPSEMSTSQKAKMFTTKITTGGSTGFPENAAGLLLTDVTQGVGYDYQMYQIYNSNRIYRRYFYNNAWTAWVKLDTTLSIPKTLNIGIVTANSMKEISVPSSGFKFGETLLVNPKFALPAGIMYNAYIETEGTVKLRLFNITSADVDCGSNEWLFKPLA